MLQRLTFPAAVACASFFEVLEDGIGLGNLLLRFGFEDFAQAKAQPIEDGRHRTGGGHLLLGKALGAECRHCRFGRQPRIGQGRPKRRVLLGLRLRQRAQGGGRLRVLVFPALPATEGGLRPHTRHARASLGQADFDSLAAPPEHPLRLAWVARAVLLRHLGLKGPPLGAGHLRGGQAQIGNLLRTDLLRKSPGYTLPEHHIPSSHQLR